MAVYHNADKKKQVPKESWQKAASPTYHSSRLQMDSSDIDPHLMHGSLGPCESVLKRHLDRLRRFCTPHECAQHTDTQTTLLATSVTMAAFMLCMQCGLKSTKTN